MNLANLTINTTDNTNSTIVNITSVMGKVSIEHINEEHSAVSVNTVSVIALPFFKTKTFFLKPI